jgi:hypothetical protein
MRALSWQKFAYTRKRPYTDLPFNRFFDEEEHWDRDAIEQSVAQCLGPVELQAKKFASDFPVGPLPGDLTNRDVRKD